MNILIQSITGDASTDEVLDWLHYLAPEGKITRLDNEVPIGKFSYRIYKMEETLELQTETGDPIRLNTLHSRWYRRGALRINIPQLRSSTDGAHRLAMTAYNYLSMEYNYLNNTLDFLLAQNTKSINRYEDNATNKLKNLSMAAKAGLTVPDTLITNDIDELELFVSEHTQVITKAISYSDFVTRMPGHSVHIGLDPTLIEEADLIELKNTVDTGTTLPALYQQYIEKRYELRIFYLDGSFYPMAIFSQASEKTKVDFRNYDEQRPNRCIPYNLPGTTEEQLRSLMRQIDMNCGSIDMIVTPSGDYVFLEVNPVGQFQWLSHNCNYGLERLIAQELCSMNS